MNKSSFVVCDASYSVDDPYVCLTLHFADTIVVKPQTSSGSKLFSIKGFFFIIIITYNRLLLKIKYRKNFTKISNGFGGTQVTILVRDWG